MKRFWPIALLALWMGACDLSVTNPGQIQDEYLNDAKAIDPIVNGVAGDFAWATTIPGGGGLYNAGAMLTDELVHVGTWIGLRLLSNGIPDDWTEADGRWSGASQARWTAEQAVERISKLVENPDRDARVATVAMWAGHMNRVMGDHYGEAVINGGGPQPHTVYYERAIGYFNRAIQIAQAINNRDILLSSLGGRAWCYVQLGRWSEALQDMRQIPTDFVFNQIHADKTDRERNYFYWWGFLREECSVWGTPFARWGLNLTNPAASEGDPRVQYDVPGRNGGDGRRPFWRQRKYRSYADPIAVIKGTDMRLLEAEYALRQGDVQTAVAKINEVRQSNNARFRYNLPLVSARTVEEAWPLLIRERGVELWLEGKRIADMRRWATYGANFVQRYIPGVVREENAGRPASEDPVRNVILSAPKLFLIIPRIERNSNPNYPRS
ncbi:MAG: RagB/SusD family nutrient uptake outer membrane protein [Bacteroidetes bacterium]|nr:RagB/SusD family nutrient uptake outer membrane protein [Rhodothermia bacterium]MCS7154415.1 RagB/SusD family nutrient uptake outer membrane protein [Bacteroidota bacterium]MCX7906788.1 RagB/SusD family nutrient uptake outer membrane protein [Bacteroidota bacterium]MDW8136932.1 RagB/SusD family nutrient uptake outer membrane protein [Bacteroidota bacterium]MDW8285197.1 RagB/SusD family nutrient uptake outer membrane protein [Bacteroidota bacterium]